MIIFFFPSDDVNVFLFQARENVNAFFFSRRKNENVNAGTEGK